MEHLALYPYRVERVDALDDFTRQLLVLATGGHAPAHHLHGAADTSQRILHLVGDDGRHLAKLGESGLFAQLLFHPDAGAQVVHRQLDRIHERPKLRSRTASRRSGSKARNVGPHTGMSGPPCIAAPLEPSTVARRAQDGNRSMMRLTASSTVVSIQV